MSIVVRFNPTNVNRERYDASLRRLEEAGLWPNPPGLEVHVAFGGSSRRRIRGAAKSLERGGLPMISNGVGGTSPGTDPLRAVLAKEARGERRFYSLRGAPPGAPRIFWM